MFVLCLLQVFIKGNESKFDKFLTVNASVYEVLVPGIVDKMQYRVQVLTFNRIGESGKSRHVDVGYGVDGGVSASRKWLIVVGIAVMAAVICALLCGCAIWLLKRKKHMKYMKASKNGGACNGEWIST